MDVQWAVVSSITLKLRRSSPASLFFTSCTAWFVCIVLPSPIKTSLIWIQHGIRVAYYTTLHQLESANGSVVPDTYLEELSERTDNVHMRHCFDYLRHALMCAADTNLETVDPETRVTTGWNSERQCRDYASVLAWAEQWRNSSDTGIH